MEDILYQAWKLDATHVSFNFLCVHSLAGLDIEFVSWDDRASPALPVRGCDRHRDAARDLAAWTSLAGMRVPSASLSAVS
jgi:hypothetical protein